MTDNPILIRGKDESTFDYKVRICIAKLNKELDLDWIEIRDYLSLDCSPDHLRKLAYAYKEMVENKTQDDYEKLTATSSERLNYKEEYEILKDGSHKSEKLLEMSAEESKNPDYLLQAHGFNKNEWELINVKNSIWNAYSKTEGVQTLYSSKVTVKPKTSGLNFDKLIELITKNVKPITVRKKETNSYSKLLEVSLYDMHFGISSLEYYENHLSEIVHKIKSRSWEKILFVIGQDLLHNDNFKGQTANGTMIEKVDMENAFNEALQFYTTMITKALENSQSVDCVYVKGNHDESISYGLFRTLQATFPQVKFEGSMKQRKAFTWEKVFVGLSHGDKGANRLIENFMSEFGKLIANADVREVHTGHLHTEISKDKYGIVQRTLATANKTDGWHEDNGFIGAYKRFQLFEYSPNSLDAIYYIQ